MVTGLREGYGGAMESDTHTLTIDQSHKPHNVAVPFLTMQHLEQQLTNLTNPTMHRPYITQYAIQTNIFISLFWLLHCSLCDKGIWGICDIAL